MASKRVRIWPTSKGGCFTCKSRHIKCDEGKPQCLRCTRSGHMCEGYQQRMGHKHFRMESQVNASEPRRASYNGQVSKVNLPQTIMAGTLQSEQQYQCIQLGLHLLSFDAFSQFGGGEEMLKDLLPQLCFSNPSVRATVAAAGAAFRSQALSSCFSPLAEAFAASQYQGALHALRQDLSQPPQGSLPIILMCFMLSLIEIFMQRDANALFHLAGAVKLLQYRRNGAISGETSLPEDALDLLFRTIDLQTSSYALNQPSRIMPLPISPVLADFTNLESAHKVLIRLAHACYSFMNQCYEVKRQQQSASASLHEEQSRLIAFLRTWLERFELTISSTALRNPATAALSTRDCHAVKLRMTALAALIQQSCITSPYETAYDAHDRHFRQIIADGEAVISARSGEPDQPAGWREGQRFTIGPGIVEPLFLTAFKYRHPLERRRAIGLLALSGREGPWNGAREARITSRLMELEEAGLDNVLHAFVDNSVARTTSLGKVKHTTTTGGPASIPEASRIYDMGFSSESSVYGESTKVVVRYRRCRNMQESLRCEHRMDPSRGIGARFDGLCMEDTHWETWTEVLEF